MSRRLFASPADAARQVSGLIRHGRALGDAVLRGRLSADERELVAVAVSRVNACAGCTFVHERWALRAGVSDDELRALELGELQNLDARKRALVAYASAHVEDGFCEPVPARVAEAVHASLTPRELAAADALARAMTLANLTTSTAGAALARVRGSDRETHRRRASVRAARDREDRTSIPPVAGLRSLSASASASLTRSPPATARRPASGCAAQTACCRHSA